MDASDLGTLAAAVSALLAALWARARKRRKGYVFRPRAHVRLYASLRTHERSRSEPVSSEPPPFDDKEKP